MVRPTSIFHNFWLKFFSVVLATVIWTTIHYGMKNELSISHLNINQVTVPITIVDPPGDPRDFKITPPAVIVSAVGDISVLRREVKASVDLIYFHGPQGSDTEVHIEAPPEITILETNPPTVSVEQISH